MDDVLKLVSRTYAQDAYGVRRSINTEREVFCKVGSISRQEFYDAGRNGLNPQYVFTVFAADYQGERVCRFRDVSYAIYRTYIIAGSDYIELYAQTEGGTNGVTQTTTTASTTAQNGGVSNG